MRATGGKYKIADEDQTVLIVGEIVENLFGPEEILHFISKAGVASINPETSGWERRIEKINGLGDPW